MPFVDSVQESIQFFKLFDSDWLKQVKRFVAEACCFGWNKAVPKLFFYFSFVSALFQFYFNCAGSL